jgi:hypothetical protein
MERPSNLYHAASLTSMRRDPKRTGTLAQGMHRQLQKIPLGVEPDTMKPIASVLGTTHELVHGLIGMHVNRHGYFHGSVYRQQLDTMNMDEAAARPAQRDPRLGAHARARLAERRRAH